MSLSAVLPPVSDTHYARGASSAFAWRVLLPAFAFALLLDLPRIVAVWQAGTFFDTDDAMRMVEVRDWLAGQSWFDLVAHRLDPPNGVFMHWTRIVDVPIAALVVAFRTILAPDAAERAARIAFPLLLQLAALAGLASLARRLAGPTAYVFAAILLVASGFTFGQFQPGRIDHHAPQITLLLWCLDALVAALAGCPKAAARAGAFAALSLGISVENVPFFATILPALPVVWAIRGAPVRQGTLAGFAAGLGGALLVVFASVVPPSRYLVQACDGLSVVHLALGLAGAGACAGLAALPAAISRNGRVAALAGAGLVLAALAVLAFPGCLGDPLAGLDPLLRTLWLAHVSEAQPLAAVLQTRPSLAPLLILPLLLGGLGIACAAVAGPNRAGWLVVLAAFAAGVAASLWQIRATQSTVPIALLGGVAAAVAIGRRPRAFARAAAVGVLLPFAPMTYALAAGTDDTAADEEMASAATCREASALAPLAALPPGLVLAPIDAGSHILAATPHSVVAAPYHRANHGNREAVDAFLANPGEAEGRVRAAGADYVAFCPGSVQAHVLSEVAPQGLAAALRRGDAPPWLWPLPLAGTPYRVYAVVRLRGG